MKKLIPAVFAVVAAALVFFGFARNLFVKDNSISRAKVVVPVVDGNSDEAKKQNGYDDELAQTSFIQLANGETLVGTAEFDVDGDSFDDQINIVKTAANPFITLIVALYVPALGSYERSYYITTNISQVRTFVCTGIDIIGKHRKSLVYQGVNNDGKISMVILQGRKTSSDFEMDVLGSFESDGTIFIQQAPRDEAYELLNADGEPFPVWVYSSENSGNPAKSASLDQIQTMYAWNEKENKFVESRSVRVAGSRIAARELAKIQDGTVGTFAKFLDGLWYKTENEGNEIRYIYFDWENSEIIFEHEGSEEVYSWMNSNLRRNGIYFSAVNKTIESLQRRFDISLVNVDEIRIKLQDDVRMLISESTLWDGNYKKLTAKAGAKQKSDETDEDKVISKLLSQSDWITTGGVVLKFSDSSYSAVEKTGEDEGRFATVEIGGKTLIQFRSENEKPFFSGSYLPSFFTTTVSEKDRRGRIIEKTTVDEDTIIFQKASVNPEGFYRDQSLSIALKKYTPPKEDEESAVEEMSALAKSESENLSAPKLTVGISPKYFSPDSDGQNDTVSISLSAECSSSLASWNFAVTNPNTGKTFWSQSGSASLPSKIVWNGKGADGALVNSATDYPYTFTAKDSEGLESSVKGFIQVDVLVVKEGERLLIQVPSIVFRSDAADFKSDAEVRADPGWNGKNYGLDQKTIENNLRVLSRVSEILKKFREYKVTIEGNANNLSGTAKEEEEVRLLSEQRAKFVRDWLIRDGVPAANLTAVGNGSKNPLTRSQKIEEKWINRRVEFILRK